MLEQATQPHEAAPRFWQPGFKKPLTDRDVQTIIDGRAHEIETEVRQMLDNWWSDGKEIDVAGVQWGPAELVDSIFKNSESDELAKLLRLCRATADKLIEDWAYEMAKLEFDQGALDDR